MRVYHLQLSKTGTNLSGGEKSMVEIIKYLCGRNIKNCIVTTDNGKRLYTKLGLLEGAHLSYFIINSYEFELRYHLFLSYLQRTFSFLRIYNRLLPTISYSDDILMCHSEFFPDTIAASALRRFFYRDVYFWFHMKAPSLFKGFEGEYTNRFNFPSLNLVHYILCQKLFALISRKNSVIILINEYYLSFFQKSKVYLVKKFGGIDLEMTRSADLVQNNYKEYDLVFMARIHHQKGILDLPDIVARVKVSCPNVKVLIIGDGDKEILSILKQDLDKKGLTQNFTFVGFINNQSEKVRLLASSKIFIFPSYFESYGLVILDAMYMGLPVIAYDLPVYSVFEEEINVIPVGDKNMFADKIVTLILNKNTLDFESKRAMIFGSKFSWEKTGEEIYKLITI